MPQTPQKHPSQRRHTLHGVAAYFNADGPVTLQMVCVDRRRQWANARNIWKNAAVRTALNTPARWLGRGRKQKKSKTQAN